MVENNKGGQRTRAGRGLQVVNSVIIRQGLLKRAFQQRQRGEEPYYAGVWKRVVHTGLCRTCLMCWRNGMCVNWEESSCYGTSARAHPLTQHVSTANAPCFIRRHLCCRLERKIPEPFTVEHTAARPGWPGSLVAVLEQESQANARLSTLSPTAEHCMQTLIWF